MREVTGMNNLKKIAVFGIVLLVASASSQELGRNEFLEAARKLPLGTNSTEVARILKCPSRMMLADGIIVNIQSQVPSLTKLSPESTWYYGCHAEAGFPTFGTLFFDEKGKLKMKALGNLDPVPGLSDGYLAILLDSIAECGGITNCNFNPAKLIKVTNMLVALGEERAIAVLREFLQLFPRKQQRYDLRLLVRAQMSYSNAVSFQSSPNSSESLLLVLRTLFEVRGSQPEACSYQLCGPWNPAWDGTLQRNLIHFVGDTPILMPILALVGAEFDDLTKQLDFFSTQGTFRTKPLRPPDDPLRLIELLTKSANSSNFDWTSTSNSLSQTFIGLQVMRMIDSPAINGDFYLQGPLSSSLEKGSLLWKRFLKVVQAGSWRWDPDCSRYVKL